MKFIWLDENKYIDSIPFLKNNYENTENSPDPDYIVYNVKKSSPEIYSQMHLLEKCGFLKIVKEINELESAEDIIPMTKRVEKLKSSPMYLKVYFPETSFLLSETELLSSTQFRKCLLREGKFIYIAPKDWVSIVKAWLNISVEIIEETEDEQMTDQILNYLINCVVYTDVDKAISRNTLFHDKKDNGVVYCFIDGIMEVINYKRKNEITSRKLRAILSDYVDGNSIQKRIFNNRYRFWRFKIEKAGVDIEKQLYAEDDDENEQKTLQNQIKIETSVVLPNVNENDDKPVSDDLNKKGEKNGKNNKSIR